METQWEAVASGRTTVPNRGVVPLMSLGLGHPQHETQQNCSYKEVLVSAQPTKEGKGCSARSGLNTSVSRLGAGGVNSARDSRSLIGVVRGDSHSLIEVVGVAPNVGQVQSVGGDMLYLLQEV